jgi:hypothetical protein
MLDESWLKLPLVLTDRWSYSLCQWRNHNIIPLTANQLNKWVASHSASWNELSPIRIPNFIAFTKSWMWMWKSLIWPDHLIFRKYPVLRSWYHHNWTGGIFSLRTTESGKILLRWDSSRRGSLSGACIHEIFCFGKVQCMLAPIPRSRLSDSSIPSALSTIITFDISPSQIRTPAMPIYSIFRCFHPLSCTSRFWVVADDGTPLLKLSSTWIYMWAMHKLITPVQLLPSSVQMM